MLLATCEQELNSEGVTRRGSNKILVACSGGADSIALLNVARILLGPHRVVVGHVDHAQRACSSLDASLVENFAASKKMQCFVTKLSNVTSDEASLREHRYKALHQMREHTGCDLILTAHTADDQAETVLLKLLRSPNPKGLCGMPRKNGCVLRPWLQVSRTLVRDYIKKKRLPFREDPSNCEPEYLRNRIRKELLPLLERRYRPGIGVRLAQFSHLLSQMWEDQTSKPSGSSYSVMPSRPKDSPKVLAVNSAVLETGTPSPDASRLQGIMIERTQWNAEIDKVPTTPDSVVFDARLLSKPFVRLPRAGDKIQPFGMTGRRKLSDVLGEARIPAALRPYVPIVASENGEVLWVPSIVRSAVAPVSSETQNVWILSAKRN